MKYPLRHILFESAVALKGFHAALELFGALVLLSFNRPLARLVSHLFSGEIAEDPHDRMAHFLYGQTYHALTGARGFLVLFLVVSAIVNLILVYALFSERYSLYPVAMATITAFAIYQSWRLFGHYSFVLAASTLFDCIVLYLIKLEYEARMTPVRTGKTPAEA